MRHFKIIEENQDLKILKETLSNDSIAFSIRGADCNGNVFIIDCTDIQDASDLFDALHKFRKIK